MFGSDLLDVAIGLVLMFFVFAVAASAIVEAISTLMDKRASDLENAIKAMVGESKDGGGSEAPNRRAAGPPADGERPAFDETSVFTALKAASGRKNKPSYVSARSFADAAIEHIDAGTRADPYDELPDPLKTRVQMIVAEVGSDLTAVKAELESWFDETMDRLQGAYKRWATAILFLVGLGLAVVSNASAFHVARDLWDDATLRAAVVAAAEEAVEGDDAAADAISDVETAVEEITGIGLPIGWTEERRAVWSEFDDVDDTSAVLATVAGWLGTAIFVTLGGPFWFDLLTKLVALRSVGAKPAKAEEDGTSASATRRLEASVAPGDAVRSVVEATSSPPSRFGGPVITRLVEHLPEPAPATSSS